MTDHALLSSESHRDLRVRTDRGAALGDATMLAMLVPDEFRQAQNEYVILFRATPERDGFAAYALLGFENGENLYLEGARWDARHRPLSIDIQPFLIGRAAPDAEASQVHVDLASPRIARADADEAIRVFDRDGRATPYLERVAEQLGALDAGYQASAGFFDALRRYDLLEPLTLEVTLDDGATNRLVGFHVIDETKLQALDGGVLGELHAAGHLMPIFMALASLANLGALIARKNRKQSGG